MVIFPALVKHESKKPVLPKNPASTPFNQERKGFVTSDNSQSRMACQAEIACRKSTGLPIQFRNAALFGAVISPLPAPLSDPFQLGDTVHYTSMNQARRPSDSQPEQDWSLSDHYAALTDLVVNHPAGLLAFHYGLWGPHTTSTREALLRANKTLTKGCELGPGQRVLDAGCGLGGTAITLAQEHGVHVTGLTNCEPHTVVAAEHAERQGVAHLVEFRHGDFMDLPFRDASFDAVLNHESVCHAADKLAYLQGVYRVLKPGGRWRAMDGFLGGRKLSDAQEAIHARVYEGWHTAPLEPWREVLAVLETAGFEQINVQDLVTEVAPFSEKLRKQWAFFGPWLIPPSRAKPYEDFKDAVIHYDEGLQEGIFTYCHLSGAKPV